MEETVLKRDLKKVVGFPQVKVIREKNTTFTTQM